MNVQCTAFGTIKMDSQREIHGQPIDVNVFIFLNTNQAAGGARWIMFSMRNATVDGPSPVTIALTSFASDSGAIVTTRTEHATPSELNLWVDALDLPVGVPLHLTAKIGATDRGAFSLETLVLPFDRGYTPVKDASGNDDSLFSYTLLGVNKETAGSSAGSSGANAHVSKLPGPGFVLAAAVVFAVAIMRAGRRTR